MPSQATRPPLVGMPAVWLRDNCPCPLCRDRVSGQRLLHITDIPADIAVAEVVPSAGTVSVPFHPDGHRAVFDRDWLARHGEPGRGGPPDPRTEDAKRLWSAADLDGEPPRGSWPRYLTEAGYRRACQSAILREGLLLLSDVPTAPGAVLEVAASLGYVRETNYGRLFDVRVESSPSNLAFTSLPIPPHTDNPYRDPVPTVQLLHCLHDAAEGGEAARVDPDLPDPPRASRLISGRAADSSVAASPVRLPGPQAAAFYAAYRAFAEPLSAPASMLTVAVGERATTGVIRRKDRI